MKTLRQQHQDLDNQINDRYTELVAKVEKVTFINYDINDEPEYDDFSDCECISYVNRSGDNVDARVLEISKEGGIYVAKDEDYSLRIWIGLNDLASLYDKITIVELLEIAGKDAEKLKL
jgi:hypothetical protein